MKWFYNMKIASKLMVFSLLMVFVAGVIGYVGMTELNNLSQADMSMYKINVVPLGQVALASRNYQQLRVGVRDVMLAETKEAKAQAYGTVKDRLKQLADFIRDYESAIVTKEERAAYDIFKSSIEKYGEDFEVFMQLIDADKKAEALKYMKGPFLVVAKDGAAAIDKLVTFNTDQARDSSNKNQVLASSARTEMLVILGVAVFLGVGLGLWISRLIAKPIKQVAERAGRLQSVCITNLGKASEAMARGNLDIQIVADTQPLQIDSKDEVGALALSVNGIITQTQSTIASFEIAAANLRKVTEEINGLIKSTQAGDLSERGKADQFEGGYRQMVSGFNASLDAVVGPLQMASSYIDRISKGDIPSMITEHYNGDFNNIKNSLNLCIETLRSLIEEDGGAAVLDAANKDLTARVRGNYQGAFGKMKESINTLIKSLDEALTQVALAAQQVAAASNQISSGSQTLSQGSSQQASSLEEVSSCFEEMASMAKRNAENAKEAQGLSEGALTLAGRGAESMKRLSEAIDKIKVSSDSTAKIIKTIDEIAFQTNLLALNAAVEAARAGDAGKGFAVVAEEVRNLAMRSAEAAKNTANMIEESVKNAEGGVSINQEVLANLTEINGQVNKVSAVMAEIAAASEQQSQGVEQVNIAFEQMNQVTQQIAANAEESASAAEELSGQAEEMKGMVGAFHLSGDSESMTRPVHQDFGQMTDTVPRLHKPLEKPAQGFHAHGAGGW